MIRDDRGRGESQSVTGNGWRREGPGVSGVHLLAVSGVGNRAGDSWRSPVGGFTAVGSCRTKSTVQMHRPGPRFVARGVTVGSMVGENAASVP